MFYTYVEREEGAHISVIGRKESAHKGVTPHVRLLVGWSDGWTVCHNFRGLQFHAPIGALVYQKIMLV